MSDEEDGTGDLIYRAKKVLKDVRVDVEMNLQDIAEGDFDDDIDPITEEDVPEDLISEEEEEALPDEVQKNLMRRIGEAAVDKAPNTVKEPKDDLASGNPVGAVAGLISGFLKDISGDIKVAATKTPEEKIPVDAEISNFEGKFPERDAVHRVVEKAYRGKYMETSKSASGDFGGVKDMESVIERILTLPYTESNEEQFSGYYVEYKGEPILLQIVRDD